MVGFAALTPPYKPRSEPLGAHVEGAGVGVADEAGVVFDEGEFGREEEAAGLEFAGEEIAVGVGGRCGAGGDGGLPQPHPADDDVAEGGHVVAGVGEGEAGIAGGHARAGGAGGVDREFRRGAELFGQRTQIVVLSGFGAGLSDLRHQQFECGAVVHHRLAAE